MRPSNLAIHRLTGLVIFLLTLVAIGTKPYAANGQIPASVEAAEQQRIAAINKARQAAISVFARGGRGGGSGVVISSDGYALTNYHVVRPAGNYMQCSMPDGQLYDAVIVGIDPVGDVALIKLLGRDDFPMAELGDSDQLRVGEWCFAIGNPFLLATDFQPTVTYGLVSGVHRYQGPAGTLLEYADCIQTDASINPGNSGGPLFNSQGQLVGINGRGSFEKRGRVNVGVGYAISINQIKMFMGALHSGRILDHATLGATVTTGERGEVQIADILENSDAFRRGIRYGDEILTFAGRDVSTVNGYKNILGTIPKGWRVPIRYRREDETFEAYVRLSGVHDQEELLKIIQGQTRPVPVPTPKPKKGDSQDGEPKKDGPKKDGPQKDAPGKKQEPGKKRPGRALPRPDGPPGPGDDPEKQPRRLTPARPAAAKIPKEIAKLIKARRGYANFYFNELNRDRVWNAFNEQTATSSAAGKWTLRGELAGGGTVDIVLSNSKVSGEFPGTTAELNLTKDLDSQLLPAGSGGLLVALHQWQRMLIEGPQKFGDVYYEGIAPVVDREGWHDVLIATRGVIESRFYFSPDNGLLAMMEMYPDTQADPCELYFDDYRDVDGRLLPHRVEIRFGNTQFGSLEWKEIELP